MKEKRKDPLRKTECSYLHMRDRQWIESLFQHKELSETAIRLKNKIAPTPNQHLSFEYYQNHKIEYRELS